MDVTWGQTNDGARGWSCPGPGRRLGGHSGPHGEGPQAGGVAAGTVFGLALPVFCLGVRPGSLCMCKSVRVDTHFSAMAGVRFRCRT